MTSAHGGVRTYPRCETEGAVCVCVFVVACLVERVQDVVMDMLSAAVSSNTGGRPRRRGLASV